MIRLMYQLLASLLQPYPLFLLSLLLVLLWAWWHERPRRRWLGIALALAGLLCLLSTMVAGHLAMGSLEWLYPPAALQTTNDDIIVVLAGNAQIDSHAGTTIRVGSETMVRCLKAVELYQQSGSCRLVVSGGLVDPSRPAAMTLAEAMRDFLVQMGVRPADITLETNSSTTFENARQTSRLLREQAGSRVLLVTSASHMYRAERCFRRQGMMVVPVACNHQALRLDLAVTDFIPSVEGIGGVQIAMHEWLGIAWYWLRGRI